MPYPAQIDPKLIGDVALRLTEDEGWDVFSLRGLAKELGVTPNALYRHVGDRDGLNIEVAISAARSLRAVMAEAGAELDGVERLVKLAHAYMEFGMARPDAYRAFIAGKPDLDDPRMAGWLPPWRLLMDAVAPLLPLATRAAGIALIGLLHGRLDLATGALRAAPATDGITDAIYAVLAGYQTLGKVEGPKPRKAKKPK